MPGHRRVPEGVDPTKPNAARVYDYLLGGKDNYEVDRVVAQRMLATAPDNRTLAWFSRQFLIRGVELALDAGVRQFLDLGAGIPTSPAVHEVAHKHDPAIRVVSVDYDPVVFAHSNAMLSGVAGVHPMLADVRDLDLVDRLRGENLVDFDQPVAILLVGVLHYIMADEAPAEMLARFRDAMAPGSFLAFTQGSDDSDRGFMDQARRDTTGTTAQFCFRSAAETTALLDGFDILPPGVVTIQDWLGGELPPTLLRILAGIVRKP
ncbi:SAM-dependent methyltransferase [Nocardia sp. NPDC051570]|uniref:SAM-dependent methyltransferase n=1 Tax=Nocardia sp. NPDC051570 TaxID=3364324 RepID=UPI00379E62CC